VDGRHWRHARHWMIGRFLLEELQAPLQASEEQLELEELQASEEGQALEELQRL